MATKYELRGTPMTFSVFVPFTSWEIVEAAAWAQFREWIREIRQQTPRA